MFEKYIKLDLRYAQYGKIYPKANIIGLQEWYGYNHDILTADEIKSMDQVVDVLNPYKLYVNIENEEELNKFVIENLEYEFKTVHNLVDDMMINVPWNYSPKYLYNHIRFPYKRIPEAIEHKIKLLPDIYLKEKDTHRANQIIDLMEWEFANVPMSNLKKARLQALFSRVLTRMNNIALGIMYKRIAEKTNFNKVMIGDFADLPKDVLVKIMNMVGNVE